MFIQTLAILRREKPFLRSVGTFIKNPASLQGILFRAEPIVLPFIQHRKTSLGLKHQRAEGINHIKARPE